MVIERRGLIYIGKRYCSLIDYLDREKILYYESETYDEIIIDLEEFEFDCFEKDNLLSKLYTAEFISLNEKQSISQHALNKLVFWR